MISQRNLKVEGRAIKINFICYYNLGGKAMNLLFPFMVFWFLCGSVMAETKASLWSEGDRELAVQNGSVYQR